MAIVLISLCFRLTRPAPAFDCAVIGLGDVALGVLADLGHLDRIDQRRLVQFVEKLVGRIGMLRRAVDLDHADSPRLSVWKTIPCGAALWMASRTESVARGLP